MEKIRINSIQRKGPAQAIVVVNYNQNLEATLNTKWQINEVNFLENIGVGGECEVEIEQKGQYTNITKVNMTGNVPQNQAPVNAVINKAVKTTPNPQRVGLFIKLAVEMMIASPQEGKNVEENLCENIQEIKKLEEFTVKLLG